MTTTTEYRTILASLAHRADALVIRQRHGYNLDRAKRIVTAQAEYRGWRELALLRFPNEF